jgi:hypothetical protein
VLQGFSDHRLVEIQLTIGGGQFPLLALAFPMGFSLSLLSAPLPSVQTFCAPFLGHRGPESIRAIGVATGAVGSGGDLFFPRLPVHSDSSGREDPLSSLWTDCLG